MSKPTPTKETAVAERCTHPHKKRCGLCDENYCPEDGCDPYHVAACRDAAKP